MPPLAAADVRLVGAFHVVGRPREEGACGRRRSIDKEFPNRRFPQLPQRGSVPKEPAQTSRPLPRRRTGQRSSTAVYKVVEPLKGLQIGHEFHPQAGIWPAFETVPERCYARRSLEPGRSSRTGGAHGGTDRGRPLGRSLRAASRDPQRDHLRHVVRACRAERGGRGRARCRRPERVHAQLDREPFPGLRLDRRARDARAGPRRLVRRRRVGGAPGAAAGATTASPQPAVDGARRPASGQRYREAPGVAAQSEVHLRPLHHRVVESLRARGRAGGRRGAGAGIQPTLHLREHRSREDPPPAGDRPLRRASTRAASRAATSRARPS